MESDTVALAGVVAWGHEVGRVLEPKASNDSRGSRSAGATVSVRNHEEIGSDVVASARSGDRDAFTAIVLHYLPRLRPFAYQMLGNPDAMDDVMQEVFLSAYRALPSFRGEAALSTWLHRITYTCCLRELRRDANNSLEEVDLLDRCVRVAESSGRIGAHHDLVAALRELSAKERATLLLVYVEGLSYKETAAVLGIRTGTVGSRLCSAREALRRALG